MSNLLPDFIFDSVRDISPAMLSEMGVKAVLCDLDSTLMSVKSSEIPKENARWVQSVKDEGIVFMILSNNSREERVAKACETLKVSYIHLARKPLSGGYRAAIGKLSLKPSEIAMVGDQIYTDVLGANLLGMVTILVQSLDLDLFYIRARRLLEEPAISRAKKIINRRERSSQ
ncbi:MAG: YqeG family HAD IIIA-type phosphatase [Bacillota bacterium]|nr:YqeG family HAD IIIA-type phosphatase [Bacillota bacterium]